MKVLYGCVSLFIICSTSYVSNENKESNECPKECICNDGSVSCTDQFLPFIPAIPNDTNFLNFSGNVLFIVKKNTFVNISDLHVRTLILSNNQILGISEDAFDSLKTIESLDLSLNVLNTWDMKYVLKSLNEQKLRSLDFSQNQFTDNLPDDFFDDLSPIYLQNLSLAGNKLRIINGSMFSRLTSLATLDLSNNRLKNILFNETHSITAIDLSYNLFSSVPSFYYTVSIDEECITVECALPDLKVLSLDHNQISNLGELRCLVNLQKLTCNFNPISLISNDQLFRLHSLETLHLDFLMVEGLHLGENAFSSVSLKQLRIGVISHEFTRDQLKIFENCSSLQKLEMRGFTFRQPTDIIFSLLFDPVLTLKYLTLMSASLYEIPSIISEMNGLEVLNLSSNYIGHWNTDTFTQLRKLKYFDVTNNRISVINKTSFSEYFLEHVVTMKLHENPYTCTCDNYWFIQWARRNNDKLENKFPSKYICSSPAWLNDRSMSMYNPTFLQCNGLEPYQTAILASGVVLFIVFITFTIYTRYKWHFRYYIYLLRSKKEKRETDDAMDGTVFKYDAFVAYTSDDRSWVISNLMAVLEGECNFSLCLHERDFLPGQTILDQISETIRHSRKVILVLSTNFAKSLWCQYEILLAQNKLMEDGGNALILILLDDIKQKYMTNCLSMLLRTVTYIKWTSNTEGKKLFWNKVIMSMKS